MKTTTRLAPQRRAGRQTLKSVLQRLTMTLMLVMLTATTAWADDSGTCGAAGNENNVTWSFVSSTQTLTISGSGPMADFSNVNEDQPWKDYRDNITSVVIGDGVTTIGKNAFYLLKVLNSPVTIPSGVTSIGEQAFRKCEALPSVTIPAGVTSIGNYAFQKCESLTSIIIPNSVTTIGNNAFSSSGLTSVIIPSSVTSIGREAFGACHSMSKVLVMAGESPSTWVKYLSIIPALPSTSRQPMPQPTAGAIIAVSCGHTLDVGPAVVPPYSAALTTRRSE